MALHWFGFASSTEVELLGTTVHFPQSRAFPRRIASGAISSVAGEEVPSRPLSQRKDFHRALTAKEETWVGLRASMAEDSTVRHLDMNCLQAAQWWHRHFSDAPIDGGMTAGLQQQLLPVKSISRQPSERTHHLALFQKEFKNAYRNYEEEANVKSGMSSSKAYAQITSAPQEFFRYLS